MKLNFIKMQGCGNDYIFFDCIKNDFLDIDFSELSKKLSNRNFSIGSDGVVLILPSLFCDAKMRMFNADGTEGNMCGNAIRCLCKYIYEEKICQKNILKIETNSGVKKCFLNINNNKVDSVKVDMGKPNFLTKEIPVKTNQKYFINKNFVIDGKNFKVSCVSVGNPHCVIFKKNIDKLKLDSIGKKIENNILFPNRINVEFVEEKKDGFYVRVWERGSGETLACGTGACAVYAVCLRLKKIKNNVDTFINLKGGKLIINCNKDRIYMAGDCNISYKGEIEI
ncbi:MAG: diaminopimelate epimerase [Clostridia bacterium]|nr:diaminopimelate epimerase [Clostridia bacterium]